MVMASIILIFSTALFFYYWQVTVQKILRRSFKQAYFQALAAAHLLEFPALREAFQQPGAAVDYSRLRLNLKCDYTALIYLLKNASNFQQRFTREERVLMVYFRLALAALSVRHWLRLGEKPAIMTLTAVLQYFANVVGARMDSLRFGGIPVHAYELVKY